MVGAPLGEELERLWSALFGSKWRTTWDAIGKGAILQLLFGLLLHLMISFVISLGMPFNGTKSWLNVEGATSHQRCVCT